MEACHEVFGGGQEEEEEGGLPTAWFGGADEGDEAAREIGVGGCGGWPGTSTGCSFRPCPLAECLVSLPLAGVNLEPLDYRLVSTRQGWWDSSDGKFRVMALEVAVGRLTTDGNRKKNRKRFLVRRPVGERSKIKSGRW